MGKEFPPLTPHQQRSVTIYQRCCEMRQRLDVATKKLGSGDEQFRTVTLRYITQEGEQIQDIWPLIDLRSLIQFAAVSAAVNLVTPIIWEEGRSRRVYSPEGAALYNVLLDERRKPVTQEQDEMIVVTDVRTASTENRIPSAEDLWVRLVEWVNFLTPEIEEAIDVGRNFVEVRYAAPQEILTANDYGKIRYRLKSLTASVDIIEGLEKIIARLDKDITERDPQGFAKLLPRLQRFYTLARTRITEQLPIDDLLHLLRLPDIINLLLRPAEDVLDFQPPPGRWEEDDEDEDGDIDE